MYLLKNSQFDISSVLGAYVNQNKNGCYKITFRKSITANSTGLHYRQRGGGSKKRASGCMLLTMKYMCQITC